MSQMTTTPLRERIAAIRAEMGVPNPTRPVAGEVTAPSPLRARIAAIRAEMGIPEPLRDPREEGEAYGASTSAYVPSSVQPDAPSEDRSWSATGRALGQGVMMGVMGLPGQAAAAALAGAGALRKPVTTALEGVATAANPLPGSLPQRAAAGILADGRGEALDAAGRVALLGGSNAMRAVSPEADSIVSGVAQFGQSQRAMTGMVDQGLRMQNPALNDPLSAPSIAFSAGQSVPQMAGTVGAATVGGLAGGPTGAMLAGFASSLTMESAANIDQTMRAIKEANPGMPDEEAARRAFLPAITVSIPAAAIDSLTGGEAAVAREFAEQAATVAARSFLARGWQGVKTLARAGAGEATTEPVQGTLSELGQVAAEPSSLTPEFMEGFGTRRVAEAAVGGLMGVAGGAGPAVSQTLRRPGAVSTPPAVPPTPPQVNDPAAQGNQGQNGPDQAFGVAQGPESTESAAPTWASQQRAAERVQRRGSPVPEQASPDDASDVEGGSAAGLGAAGLRADGLGPGAGTNGDGAGEANGGDRGGADLDASGVVLNARLPRVAPVESGGSFEENRVDRHDKSLSPESRAARVKFDEKGDGHRAFSRNLDGLVDSGTLVPEQRDVLLAAFDDTEDVTLATMPRVRTISDSEMDATEGNTTVAAAMVSKRPALALDIKLREAWERGRGKGELDPAYNEPVFDGASVFLEEYGHAAYYALLTDAERSSVQQAFDSMGPARRRRYFKQGIADTPAMVEYAANAEGGSNPNAIDEFVARVFVEYVISRKVPEGVQGGWLRRMGRRLIDAVERLRGRRPETALEAVAEIMRSGRGPDGKARAARTGKIEEAGGSAVTLRSRLPDPTPPRKGRKGKADPTSDAIDIAITAAAIATHRGATDAKGIKAAAADAATRLNLPKDRAAKVDQRAVTRLTRRITEAAREGLPENASAADREAAFDRAVASIESGQFRAPKKGDAKRAIRENTGQAPQEKTVTERDALKSGVAKAERAARDADRVARREERQEAAVKLRDVAKRGREELKRARQIASIESRGKVDALKHSTGVRRQMRKVALAVVETLPRPIRGAYLRRVSEAESLSKLTKIVEAVERDLATWELRQSIKAADKAAGSNTNARELEPELRQELREAQGVIAEAKRILGGQGLDAPTAGQVTASAGTTSAPDVERTIGDLQAMRDELERAIKTMLSVRHVQKTMDEVRIKGELQQASGIRDQMVERLSERAELAQSETPEATDAGMFTRAFRRRTNWESIMMLLDGFRAGGPAAQLWREVLKGRHKSLLLDQRYRDGLGNLASKHGFPSLGRLLAEMSGSLGPRFQKYVDVKAGGFNRLTLGQASYIYAASSDVGFRARVRAGQDMQFGDARTNKPFKLTEADLDRVAEALPQNVKDFIDEAKDLFERTYFNGLSRVNKNLKGYFLERVPGYWGIKLNRDFSQLRGVPDSWRGNYIRAMEMTGFLQEREGPSKTPILIGDFGVDLMLRSKSAATVIGKAETTKLLTQTVLHPDVVTTITRTLGVSTVQRIKNRVALYSGGDIADADERAFRKLLSMWSRSKTQLWVWTWIRNAVAGTPRMLNEIGGKNVARNARPSLEAFKELKKYSPELRERWEAGGLGSFYDPAGADVSDATLGDAAKATAGNLVDTLTRAGKFDFTGSKQSLGGAWTAWGRVLDGITIANYFDAQPAITAYLHFKRVAPPTLSAEGKKRWAARQTVRAFERTSNTATIEYANDIQLQARKSLGVAMFVPFTGDTAKAQSMLYQALGKARTEKSVKPVLRTAAALALGSVMSAGVAVLRGVALGEDDEEKLTAMGARRFLQEIISLVPVGTFISPATVTLFDIFTGTRTGSFSVVNTPFVEIINKVIGIGEEIARGINSMGERQTRRAISAAERYWNAAGKAGQVVGELLGVPAQYWSEVRKAHEGWAN